MNSELLSPSLHQVLCKRQARKNQSSPRPCLRSLISQHHLQHPSHHSHSALRLLCRCLLLHRLLNQLNPCNRSARHHNLSVLRLRLHLQRPNRPLNPLLRLQLHLNLLQSLRLNHRFRAIRLRCRNNRRQRLPHNPRSFLSCPRVSPPHLVVHRRPVGDHLVPQADSKPQYLAMVRPLLQQHQRRQRITRITACSI